jgi:hypothetical protein
MADRLMQAAQMVESQLDQEINRLENLDGDDLAVIRKNRMEAMKQQAEARLEWDKAGHGTYDEIADEKEFFETCKRSRHVVCHFYRESTFRCKIVNKHLDQIARAHHECRFVKIDAEKAKFLTERLRIKIIPTIALIKDTKTIDYIVGFQDLGNTDDFDTEMLEWRIAKSAIIEYSGDLVNPPEQQSKKKFNSQSGNKKKPIIRVSDKGNLDDSDENDW